MSEIEAEQEIFIEKYLPEIEHYFLIKNRITLDFILAYLSYNASREKPPEFVAVPEGGNGFSLE